MLRRMTTSSILSCLALAGCSSDPTNPMQPQAATPTPTPEPTPEPIPEIQACSLPDNPGRPPCQEEVPSFEAEVIAAQAKVLAEQPQLFAGTKVLRVDDYVQAVAAELRAMGFCAAQGGPADEVAVKVTNEWNDQYDIVLGSTGEPWIDYTVTCRPSRF